MRKAVFGAILGVTFFAVVAIAIASVNSVSYTATLKEKGKKPTAHKPVNLSYTGTLDVSRPDGSQPDTAPDTDIFFAKQYKNNGKKFPSCNSSQIDGKSSVPAKCKKAIVGSGNATAMAGQPGSHNSILEQLTVTAYNGAKGKQILLALNGNAPVAIHNRVIVGTLTKASGKFGLRVRFHTPPELQTNLGLQVALTHFGVTIPATKTVKIKGKKSSYLQLVGCPKNKQLPNEATVHFNQDNGSPGGESVTTTGTYACK